VNAAKKRVTQSPDCGIFRAFGNELMGDSLARRILPLDDSVVKGRCYWSFIKVLAITTVAALSDLFFAGICPFEQRKRQG
jgi:hypothetical protein